MQTLDFLPKVRDLGTKLNTLIYRGERRLGLRYWAAWGSPRIDPTLLELGYAAGVVEDGDGHGAIVTLDRNYPRLIDEDAEEGRVERQPVTVQRFSRAR